MIEFHLDGRSGLSPYLQLVRQVRHALRLGLLREGDQLPTVKDVVGALAINPNTVLKAYRELEHDGLVAARPGVGTFVTRTLTDASLAAHGPLRRDLAAGWSRRGWPASTTRASRPCSSPPFVPPLGRRSHDRRPAGPTGLTKSYGRRWALSDCTLDVPPGHVVGLVGPNGAGKTHAAQPGRRACSTPTAGTIEVLGGRPGRPAQLAKVGFVAQDTPTYAGPERRRPPAPRRAAEPGAGTTRSRGGGSSGSASTRAQKRRQALRRPARPARAHPRPRQAARAADPRRAGGQPRPARPARVPAGPDGGGRRARAQRRPVLAPGLRPRARLRPPDRARRLAGAGRPATSTTLLATHHRLTGPRRDAASLPADQTSISASHTDRQTTFVVRTEAPILDPAWTVDRAEPGGPRAGLHGPAGRPASRTRAVLEVLR